MTAPVTAADIAFDAVAHEYRTPDGARVPSVTEILGAVGVSVDFEELGGRSAKTFADIERKRALGHALHADAHAYDDDDLNVDTVHAEVRPYLDAWITFRRNTGIRPIVRERRVYHPTWRYAGTLDGLFVTPQGVTVLVDIKTGDPTDSGCQWQTAGYAEAYRIDHPNDRIGLRWGVQLVPGKVIPYVVHPYDSWRDVLEFQAFVTTYYRQARRRISSKG